tara:strand:- start:1325 stop:1537 length:213 start_codon:yes stop_codon:yes gene_type:complete
MKFEKPSNVCPQCSSENIKVIDYMGVKCKVCSECGLDERNLYEVYPEEKTSQKEKGKFSPYKAGGGKRGK